jgi:hypothetical protein
MSCSTTPRPAPWLALATIALTAAACAESAPERPTWADVAPILASQCARCHGSPALGGPPSFRLDRYDDMVTPEGRVLGAAAMAEWIAARAADGSMPPRFPLAQYDVDVLRRWYATREPLVPGAERSVPPRGPARPDNQAPTMTLQTTASPDAVELAYELRDPDRDLVTGQLHATVGAITTLVGEVHSGRGRLSLDPAVLPAGSYQLTATVDDGAGPSRLDLGATAIAPPRPAPPRLTLGAPMQGSYVAASELPFEVELTAIDADTTNLTVTVELIDDRAPATPVERKQVAMTAGSRRRVALGTATTPASLIYRVVATVSDGAASYQTSSARFRISRETTTDTFTTISNDVLGPLCYACHLGTTRVPHLAIDLSKYRGTASVLGVYDLRARIYQRAIVAETMPPGSAGRAGASLVGEARDRLARWLLAGAPE